MAMMPTERPVIPSDTGESPFVESPLSQRLTRNGVTVQVEIYGDQDGKWILEVVDQRDGSHVWDEHFATDHEALAEAIRALEEAPMDFVGEPASSLGVH